MSTTLESPLRNRIPASVSGGYPGGLFISTLQEQVAAPGMDLPTKLNFWKFGLNLVQKLELERFSLSEEEFERGYVGMLLLLLMQGHSIVGEIKEPTMADHVKANLENLNSKYVTFKMPPPDAMNNRLLDLLAA